MKLCDCIAAKRDFDDFAELWLHLEKINDNRLRFAENRIVRIVERARGVIVAFLTSLWLHYIFRLESISNLYALTPMFAISVDTERESSRNVIADPYLEKPAVLARRKR